MFDPKLNRTFYNNRDYVLLDQDKNSKAMNPFKLE